MTLIDDLLVAARDAEAFGFKDRAARLRAHAERIREEMRKVAKAAIATSRGTTPTLRALERMNNGPVTP